MNTKRLTLVLMIALGGLLLGLIGITYVASGIIRKEANQLATNRATVDQLTGQTTTLAKSKADIAKYSQLETIAQSIVPQDKDQAATVREIIKIASSSKVPLTTITFPSSTLGTLPSGAKATPGAAVAAATSAKANLSQLSPVKGLAGVYNLQITLGNNSTNTVSYTQLTAFLKGLENNRRTAAVSSITIQPQTTDPKQLVFNLIINTYIKP